MSDLDDDVTIPSNLADADGSGSTTGKANKPNPYQRIKKFLNDTPLTEWDKTNRWVLIGSGLFFIALYMVRVLLPIPGWLHIVISVILDLLWVLFLVDFALTACVAEHSGRWLSRHAAGLLLLLLPLIPGMRFVRMAAAIYAIHRGVRGWVRGHLSLYIIGAGILIVSMGALLVYEAESGIAGSSIDSYPDALWWAFVSITTIGYGAYYPVTFTGRMVTVVMVIAGVALIGVITGACASWVIREVGNSTADDEPVTRGQADKIERKLELLSDKIGSGVNRSNSNVKHFR